MQEEYSQKFKGKTPNSHHGTYFYIYNFYKKQKGTQKIHAEFPVMILTTLSGSNPVYYY